MLQTLRLAAPALLLALPACVSITTQAGYTQMSVSGDIGLTAASGSSTVVIDQDLESALGIGDEQGSGYVRAQADLGVPVLTVSGFMMDEEGQGTLNADFGNVPAGRDVLTDFSMTNIKASLGFEFGIGPISITPGLAVDYFDVNLKVEDATGFATEELDLQSPVPMLFVRGTGDIGIVSGVLEIGYVTIPETDDVEGTLWDIEALVEVRPAGMFHAFAGYRSILLDAEGESDGDTYSADLEIGGWVIGGGIRF
jgi:hypothetical protein